LVIPMEIAPVAGRHSAVQPKDFLRASQSLKKSD
jgi:hypothetical protein